ncbi:MAG: metallophosphoesterase [Myxococcota bacterium]
MTAFIHMSDLHLMGFPQEQAAILDALVEALRNHRTARGAVDLILITGDVFDSAVVDPHPAVDAFVDLRNRVWKALDAEVPITIVPGNHDRRRAGLFAPHREELFQVLHERLADSAWVHGTDGPFLANVVDPAFHGLPLWVLVYDSSYLPQGYVSAGGMMRQEDLLQAAAKIRGRNPDWPVLFLLHHHLVPTPLTDLGPIEVHDSHPVVRFGIQQILPRLVANADREELMMTALGAGTALSTLHTLGRPVLVLRGHKHYPTVRMLDATFQNHGDVMLVSAGSAGTAQSWSHGHGHDVARLWPSFNVIELDDDLLEVETASFGWKGNSAGELVYRSHVRARRSEQHWIQEPLPPAPPEPARLSKNSAVYTLRPSIPYERRRFDYICERFVQPLPGLGPSRYMESIEAEAGAAMSWIDGREPEELPATVELPMGTGCRISIRGGVGRALDCRRLSESPYGWLGLMNRYASELATLDIRGLGESTEGAFASITDLGTGLEQPIELERAADEDRVHIAERDCPPRQLLRIYWPLLKPTASARTAPTR